MASSSVVDLVQRHQLVLVAEQHVDLVGHERPEVVAVAVDAERVAERQRHQSAVGVGDLRSMTERSLGLVAVEQVALHVQHRAGRDRGVVDVGGVQQRRHAEVGVHRAFGVGGDDDDAAARGRLRVGLTGTELHADGTQVVAEHLAELVVADLADVRGPAAEAGDAAHGVRRRAAAHLDRTAQGPVDVQRAIGVDQRHRPLHQVVLVDEVVVGVGDDVDQSVADADDVVARSDIAVGSVGHVEQRYPAHTADA